MKPKKSPVKNETSVAHNQDGHHLSQLDAVGESCRLYPPEIDMAPAKGLVVDYCPC